MYAKNVTFQLSNFFLPLSHVRIYFLECNGIIILQQKQCTIFSSLTTQWKQDRTKTISTLLYEYDVVGTTTTTMVGPARRTKRKTTAKQK